MMTIGEVRELVKIATSRDDQQVAAVLEQIAKERVDAVIRARVPDGARWWLSTDDIPLDTMFRAVHELCSVTWRRVARGCRALPPDGTGRIYEPWLIDQAWCSEGLGFVEATPTATVKEIARHS